MERFVHVATVAAAVVAAASFGFGIYQFSETQKLARSNLEMQAEALAWDREIKAVELFQKFNEQAELIEASPPSKDGKASFWKQNALMATTEALFTLTEGEAGWDQTVTWMLWVQEEYLTKSGFNCSTFSAKFVERMRQTSPGLKCV